ncbi:hypothetical protein A7K69_13335 [Parageobacillus thermoglucosidasius]|uniref:Uncharacterized protein n=1 Tax=Parageobacillus thermoglucosidasius TaxID=1426 RepID=A0A1B7KNX6_PARTM|nr:hypothetical protein A7K69_13335 [Parageobacillus thermoglucosidasius]
MQGLIFISIDLYLAPQVKKVSPKRLCDGIKGVGFTLLNGISLNEESYLIKDGYFFTLSIISKRL